jgi:hypothetical protein
MTIAIYFNASDMKDVCYENIKKAKVIQGSVLMIVKKDNSKVYYPMWLIKKWEMR